MIDSEETNVCINVPGNEYSQGDRPRGITWTNAREDALANAMILHSQHIKQKGKTKQKRLENVIVDLWDCPSSLFDGLSKPAPSSLDKHFNDIITRLKKKHDIKSTEDLLSRSFEAGDGTYSEFEQKVLEYHQTVQEKKLNAQENSEKVQKLQSTLSDKASHILDQSGNKEIDGSGSRGDSKKPPSRSVLYTLADGTNSNASSSPKKQRSKRSEITVDLASGDQGEDVLGLESARKEAAEETKLQQSLVEQLKVLQDTVSSKDNEILEAYKEKEKELAANNSFWQKKLKGRKRKFCKLRDKIRRLEKEKQVKNLLDPVDFDWDSDND
jgi:hypothetical protein